MTTKIFAGVGDTSRHHAGWYIFCNGRCILEADQDRTTGWAEVTEAGVSIPKYHAQFARFRGFAFLDSDDASVLPWNTTQTGLDPDSVAYLRLKPRLIEAARPVIDFLNSLDSEQDLEESDKLLTRAVGEALSVPLERIPQNRAFGYTVPAIKGPPLSRISYKKPKGETDILKEAIGATSLTDLGEKSFEFSFQTLIEEE